MELNASGSIASEEACEEACEDDCEDDCKSIRRLFRLPPLFFGVVVAGLLPLLPPVRVSPRGVLQALVRPRKRGGECSEYLIRLVTLPRGVLTANVVFRMWWECNVGQYHAVLRQRQQSQIGSDPEVLIGWTCLGAYCFIYTDSLIVRRRRNTTNRTRQLPKRVSMKVDNRSTVWKDNTRPLAFQRCTTHFIFSLYSTCSIQGTCLRWG